MKIVSNADGIKGAVVCNYAVCNYHDGNCLIKIIHTIKMDSTRNN